MLWLASLLLNMHMAGMVQKVWRHESRVCSMLECECCCELSLLIQLCMQKVVE